MMILTALDHLITLILAMLVLALGAAWSLRTRLAAHLEEEAAELRDQLDKLLRDQGREGSNLEYLKNIK